MIDAQFVHAGIYLVTACAAYYLWRRYADKDCLRLSIIGSIAVPVAIWDYVAKNLLILPAEVKLLSGSLTLVFSIFVVLFVLKVGIKVFNRKE